jgi:formyl transferase-like protein
LALTDDLEKESPLNQVLVHDQAGRRFVSVEGSRWGELILPAKEEAATLGDTGLRLLAVSAYTYSLSLLAAVFDFQRRNPGQLRLVGLATDDPINADAHIDLRKRVWKYYSQDERVAMETRTVEAALKEGVPVFTGEIKSSGFRALISEWAPDAIVVCVCGQIFDAAIIEAARCGVYNLHPTDLAKGIGAGPTPYEEVVKAGEPWSRWTIHRLTVDVDSGPIVGQSPPVRVGDATGRITGDPRRFYDRMGLPVGALVGALIAELVRRDGPVSKLDFSAAVGADLQAAIGAPLD